MSHRFLPLVFIVYIILAGSLCAQVIIREKVLLTPNDYTDKKNNRTRVGQSASSIFIMQKSGILKILYGDANRLQSRIPFSAALVATIQNHSTVRVDTFVNRFQYRDSTDIDEPTCNPRFYRDYYYGDAVQPFVVGAVTQGDTVRFSYVTDLDPPNGTRDTLYLNTTLDSSAYGWNIRFGIYNNCLFRWNERLDVFIGVDEAPAITLGETKYYQAVLSATNNGKLLIQESSTPEAGGLTAIQFEIKRDTSLPDLTKGKRLGVYYEYKDLPSDQIRFVGKYWTKDSTYRVKLKATMAGKMPDSLSIEVKKPDSLLSASQSPTYKLSKTVFNDTLTIDSLCIALGGKYGIPPHMLKGQMLKEAATKEFSGFSGFAPTYRYEPYKTQFNTRNVAGLFSTSRFRVRDDGNMGTDAVPANHQNVKPISYPTTRQTVWDMVYNYSVLNNNPGPIMYAQYKSGSSELDFKSFGGKTIQMIYDKILKKKKDFFHADSLTEFLDTASIAARDSISKFLQKDWNGKIKNGPKGLENISAQTRIASSYGLLQMLYSTALEFGYDSTLASSIPEKLNIDSVGLPICMKKHLKDLNDTLHISSETNNWNIGFDVAIREMFQRWNKGETGYGQKVISNANSFLPQRKSQ